MPEQNYKNHVRYYPAHHFVFYPLLFIALGICVWYYFKYPDLHSVWIGLIGILVLLGWCSFMMRQHYALILQNRLVRMEMRFRYYALTGKRLETLENKLSFGQIAALRFASDEELPALLNRAIAENLSGDDIKKSIVNWQADDMRV